MLKCQAIFENLWQCDTFIYFFIKNILYSKMTYKAFNPSVNLSSFKSFKDSRAIFKCPILWVCEFKSQCCQFSVQNLRLPVI